MADPRAPASPAGGGGTDSDKKKTAVAPALLIIENTLYFDELFELLAVEEIDREQVCDVVVVAYMCCCFLYVVGRDGSANNCSVRYGKF